MSSDFVSSSQLLLTSCVLELCFILLLNEKAEHLPLFVKKKSVTKNRCEEGTTGLGPLALGREQKCSTPLPLDHVSHRHVSLPGPPSLTRGYAVYVQTELTGLQGTVAVPLIGCRCQRVPHASPVVCELRRAKMGSTFFLTRDRLHFVRGFTT
jgi:hypothetical protein